MVNVVIFCCATEVFRKGCLYFEEFIFPCVIYNPKVRDLFFYREDNSDHHFKGCLGKAASLD